MINMLGLLEVFLILLIGFGIFSFVSRQRISTAVDRLKIPELAAYIIIAVPLILVEEFLTAEGPYLSTIVVTLPAFLFFFLILFVIIRIFKINYLGASAVFGAMGWVNEFLLVGRLWSLASLPVVLLVMSILAFMIYAVLALLPTYYITNWSERTAQSQKDRTGII